MQSCLICLATGTKFYSLQDYNLQSYYNEITGLSEDFHTDTDYGMLSHLCWECSHRLHNFHRFKSKALQSYHLLKEILRKESYITDQLLKCIDRHTNGLASSLNKQVIDPETDVYFYESITLKSEEVANVLSDISVQDLELKSEKEIIDIPVISNDLVKDESSDSDFNNDEILSANDETDEEYEAPKPKVKQIKKPVKKTLKVQKKVDKRLRPLHEAVNEELFTITLLSEEEQLLELQKRKETSNYKTTKYQCEMCYKGFKEVEAYKSHMTRHTDRWGPHKCPICHLRYASKREAKAHGASHALRLGCKQCDYVTTVRHAAKRHEDFHKGTTYKCPHCTEEFCKYTTYLGHLRIKHPSDFVCELCGYSFVSLKGKNMHKKLKHRFENRQISENSPYCEKCDVRFASEEALQTHLKLSSRHKDPIEALEESERKRRKPNTARAKSTESSGPIKCEQCDTQLSDARAYHKHFRRAHPDKNRTYYPKSSLRAHYMCEVCGKMFQSQTMLKDHSHMHSDVKQFSCAQCGKAFQRKYRLLVHEKIHGDARKTYPCSICGKTYSTSSNVSKHMASHSSLKPYKCEMCGKSFRHGCEKRAHFTYVHLKKPWPKRNRDKRRSNAVAGDFVEDNY